MNQLSTDNIKILYKQIIKMLYEVIIKTDKRKELKKILDDNFPKHNYHNDMFYALEKFCQEEHRFILDKGFMYTIVGERCLIGKNNFINYCDLLKHILNGDEGLMYFELTRYIDYIGAMKLYYINSSYMHDELNKWFSGVNPYLLDNYEKYEECYNALLDEISKEIIPKSNLIHVTRIMKIVFSYLYLHQSSFDINLLFSKLDFQEMVEYLKLNNLLEDFDTYHIKYDSENWNIIIDYLNNIFTSKIQKKK